MWYQKEKLRFGNRTLQHVDASFPRLTPCLENSIWRNWVSVDPISGCTSSPTRRNHISLTVFFPFALYVCPIFLLYLYFPGRKSMLAGHPMLFPQWESLSERWRLIFLFGNEAHTCCAALFPKGEWHRVAWQCLQLISLLYVDIGIEILHQPDI